MALINVTEPAAERIRELLEKEGKLDPRAAHEGHRRRLLGLRYELAFDDQVAEASTPRSRPTASG